MTAIVLYDDPILRVPCEPVTRFDSHLEDLGHALADATRDADGLAVAAPQLGVSEQVFAFILPSGELGVAVNPWISDGSGSWMYKEGCLSLPGKLWWVNRPNRVTLHYTDVKGKRVTRTDDALIGRLWQHEVDHLHGRLVIDRLTRAEKKSFFREQAKS